jgi:hypothetical protein
MNSRVFGCFDCHGAPQSVEPASGPQPSKSLLADEQGRERRKAGAAVQAGGG